MKITISLSAARPDGGIEEDAFEYATHQVSFDRQVTLTQIKQAALHSGKFTAGETQSDPFLRGIERAYLTARKKNPTLRGSILWIE
jgi:hypothetical protein